MNATPAPPQPEKPPSGPGVVSAGWLAADSMFGTQDHRAKRAFGASLATIALHVGFLLLAVIVFTTTAIQEQPQEPLEIPRVVYLQEKGPGGGGGGSPAPAPPKQLQVPAHKAPDPVPVTVTPPPPTPPPPTPTLTAPIITPNATVFQATGSSTVSLAGPSGGGRGTGLGSGTGSGVGPGTGGGFGGGAFRPGNGITNPVPIRSPAPNFTAEAMRAKIQGEVVIEAVVLADGTIGDARVVTSLDRVYGLDEAALRTAKQWLFRPAVDREGKPVPVLVTLELSFNLH